MTKRKRIIIVSGVVAILLIAILFFLLRTPSFESTKNGHDLSRINVLEGTHGPIFGETAYRLCDITDSEKNEKIIELFNSTNFKYSYEGSSGITYLGLAKKYDVYFYFETESRKVDITIANDSIYMYIDGQSVTFGLFGSIKYENEKVEFMEQFLRIIEDDFVKMEESE